MFWTAGRKLEVGEVRVKIPGVTQAFTTTKQPAPVGDEKDSEFGREGGRTSDDTGLRRARKRPRNHEPAGDGGQSAQFPRSDAHDPTS